MTPVRLPCLCKLDRRSAIAAAITLLAGNAARSEEDPPFPSPRQVGQVIDEHFRGLADHRPTDLISRGQVEPLFGKLAKIGWRVAEEKKIVSLIPDDSEAIVASLHSPPGKRFMRQVAGYSLIYDRLDRIAEQRGGRELLRDLVKLPDAARHVQAKPNSGRTDIAALLPKQASGAPPSIKEYDRPTGRIYTAAALKKRLDESYAQAKARQAS